MTTETIRRHPADGSGSHVLYRGERTPFYVSRVSATDDPEPISVSWTAGGGEKLYTSVSAMLSMTQARALRDCLSAAIEDAEKCGHEIGEPVKS